MKVEGRHYRSITRIRGDAAVEVIDQRQLPHRFVTVRLESLDQAATAIREMWVRGAPLIGATAAYGIVMALRDDPSERSLVRACEILEATRPTAINLRWATTLMRESLVRVPESERAATATSLADEIVEEDVRICEAIGDNGLDLIRQLHEARGPRPVNVLTHCNAGWLATVDWGTALAPVFKAYDSGIPIHVWVDETRPRNQGARLTAWELSSHGVDHTVIVDNAGGHLMQRGLVDVVVTGTDRTTSTGGVFNKIGTYLKALAAYDTDVPFYVAVPGPSIDWGASDDWDDVPIEERPATEVTTIHGRDDAGSITRVHLTPQDSPAANPGFDFTPARLVTGLITERGVCAASAGGLLALYPERAPG